MVLRHGSVCAVFLCVMVATDRLVGPMQALRACSVELVPISSCLVLSARLRSRARATQGNEPGPPLAWLIKIGVLAICKEKSWC